MSLNNNLLNQEIDTKNSQEINKQFLQNLQHEISRPVIEINSMGQRLKNGYDTFTKEQKQGIIKDIAYTSERLSNLINNIIDLSKLTSSKDRPEIKLIDLSTLVRERVEVCKKLRTRGQSLQELVLIIEDNISVSCNKHYISRAIDNIIINAILYCKEGKITIKLSKLPNNQIEFKVIDEGIGIPKEELHNIFEIFIVSSRTKGSAPTSNCGIGLTLAREIIRLHKGHIWAESEGTSGATITFTLPEHQ